MWVLELNSGPVEEQYVLLTTEPSFNSRFLVFFFFFFFFLFFPERFLLIRYLWIPKALISYEFVTGIDSVITLSSKVSSEHWGSWF